MASVELGAWHGLVERIVQRPWGSISAITEWLSIWQATGPFLCFLLWSVKLISTWLEVLSSPSRPGSWVIGSVGLVSIGEWDGHPGRHTTGNKRVRGADAKRFWTGRAECEIWKNILWGKADVLIKHMKRCPTSSAIREMRIKTTTHYYLLHIKMAMKEKTQ